MKPWLEQYSGNSLGELLELEEKYRIDSLVLALEQRLGLNSDITSQEELVISLCAFDRELNNGGFDQYLTNSSRDYAHRLGSDLRSVGLPNAAEKVESLYATLGLPPQPSEDLIGKLVDEDNWIDDDPFEDDLESFDDYYFDNICDCSELVWEWVKRNQTKISIG